MHIRPFAARRPIPGMESRTTAPPYDVLTRRQALQLANDRPESMLYVTRPEIAFPGDSTTPEADLYEAARRHYQKLKDDGVLTSDPDPGYYIYEQQLGDIKQRGLVALFDVQDYLHGVIKPHETTRRDKERERTQLLQAVGAQPGLVFLACRGTAWLDELLNSDPPNGWVYDFKAADGAFHRVARIACPHHVESVMATIPTAYIADGHHRAAAAAGVWRSSGNLPTAERFFPAVLFAAGDLHVFAYHRCVRTLENHTPASFRRALVERFNMAGADRQAPIRKGVIRLVMADGCWDLSLKTDEPAEGMAAGLDVAVLQRLVLQPLLGIDDPRANANLDFIGGIHAPAEMARRLQTAEAAAVFMMAPVAVETMMDVADRGESMPPKSTWFEPKLLEGLLIHDRHDPSF